MPLSVLSALLATIVHSCTVQSLHWLLSVAAVKEAESVAGYGCVGGKRPASDDSTLS